MRILVVIGTRPEAIKMAPVVRRLKADRAFETLVASTGQHRELLTGACEDLGLGVDLDLGIMRPGQSPSEVLGRVALAMDKVLAREKPGLVLVQGDTTSALAAALAAFHRKVPVGHVEAGLRTGDFGQPFPEEMNRVAVDRLSALRFAPTKTAFRTLLAEGADPRSVFLTGNTVVDALKWALLQDARLRSPSLKGLAPEARVVVVTLHRRESFGRPIESACRGILKAARSLPDITWVYPEHPNPMVRSARRFLVHSRILVCPSLGYLDFVRLMRRAEFLVTDSGGIQEEAACLNKMVLVARDKSDRPEILSTWGVPVGLDAERIAAEARRLARGGPRPNAPNPFGDGRAAERIHEAIGRWAHGRR